MNTLAQTLSEEQQALVDKVPKNQPNPPLIPSPFLWSVSYTSPAWPQPLSELNQNGEGYYNAVSNQFNSAETQPLGLPQTQLGGQTGGMWGYEQKIEGPSWPPRWEL